MKSSDAIPNWQARLNGLIGLIWSGRRLHVWMLPLSMSLVPGYLPAGTPSNTLTVCPSGCDHTTIQAAVFASDPGGTVEVQVAGEHTEGPIQIFDDVTIRGLGRNVTYVQQAIILPLADRSVFQILLGATVTIRDMTIRHGKDPFGGCVFNLDGDLLLLEVNVSDCEGGNGGGILNRSQLTLREVTVANNRANWGAGIFNDTAAILLADTSSIDNNEAETGGGGLYNVGEASLILTSISQNTGAVGGGIWSNGILVLDSSSVEANTITEPNSGGGGIFSTGGLEIRKSSISSNTAGPRTLGGGLAVNSNDSVKIRDSTFAGNVAENGGGISVSAHDFELINTTVSANKATASGGGIYVGVSAGVRLANVTVSNNTADSDNDNNGNGGGIYVATDGEIRILNSIIGGNFDDSDVFHVNGPDCFGNLISPAYSLIGSLGSAGIGRDPVCFIIGLSIGNTIGVAAQLGPLAFNGGPTLTHALLPGSPAINTGDPTGCFSHGGLFLTTDQRGFMRQNRCDRGAYERGAVAPDLIFADGFETGSASRWTSSQ